MRGTRVATDVILHRDSVRGTQTTLAQPVEFFHWIRQSEFSVEKSRVEEALFARVRMLDVGFSRKRSFSTDKPDYIINGLKLHCSSKGSRRPISLERRHTQ